MADTNLGSYLERVALRPDTAGATLTIDLGGLRSNYLQLKSLCHPAACGAAIKGNAYGIGHVEAARILERAGCRHFFVAQLSEAAAVRPVVPDADIYVLNGIPTGGAAHFVDLDVRPVLGSLEEFAEWSALCRDRNQKLPAAIHLDTGMNRLGLRRRDVEMVARSPELCAQFECSLVMSHLACSDLPDHPMNRAQASLFDVMRAQLPEAPASIANSAGVLNGKAYHYDLIRPGIALYGGNPIPAQPNPMARVVALETSVIQVREVPVGETVGYGATWCAKRASRIALLPVGYFDGYFRSLSRTNDYGDAGVYIDDKFAPLAGRVSMDTIAVDVTDIASGKVRRGTRVELLGPNIGVDDVAQWSGTISYEVLTSLGERYARVYTDQASEQ